MLISIVGKSNSGKSYISRTLMNYSKHIHVLDIDKIGHEVLTHEDVILKLVEAFGSSILENGRVVRKRLSKIVFNSSIAMDKLTDITWEAMEKIIDAFILAHEEEIVILDWLLLPKTKYFNLSDFRILVTASYETRLKRAIIRDNITKEAFDSRDNAGLDFNPNDFTYVINTEDEKNVEKEVRLIYDKSIVHR